MRIALVQSPVVWEKEPNVENAIRRIKEAASLGADLVMLPEMFCCPYTNRCFTPYSEEKGGYIYTSMQNAAKENGVYLVAGTFPEREGEKIYNTAFVFDPEGREIARHRKMHLFDINVKNGQCFKESRTFTAGDEITCFDTPFGRLGLCICFDVRFPELARLMALDGAKAILIPAAFNMTTGPLHWEISFRMRAVDNQVFTVGCSPARDENGLYVAYGHSIVCDPWGHVVAQAGHEENILFAEIDLEETESVREQLPLLSARRTDLYRIEAL